MKGMKSLTMPVTNTRISLLKRRIPEPWGQQNTPIDYIRSCPLPRGNFIKNSREVYQHAVQFSLNPMTPVNKYIPSMFYIKQQNVMPSRIITFLLYGKMSTRKVSMDMELSKVPHDYHRVLLAIRSQWTKNTNKSWFNPDLILSFLVLLMMSIL